MGARVSTGLAGLDAQLGGGIPPGSLQLLMGEPMNAFELFGHHFAAAGTAAGPTLVVSVHGSEEDWRPGVENVGGDPKRLQHLTLPRKKGKQEDWELPVPGPKERMIVEDASLWIRQLGFDPAFQRLRTLKDNLRKSGATTLLMALAPLHDAYEATRLRDLADGNLELGFEQKAFAMYPYLKVAKMRGVADAARMLLFRETERGLLIEATRRVA